MKNKVEYDVTVWFDETHRTDMIEAPDAASAGAKARRYYPGAVAIEVRRASTCLVLWTWGARTRRTA